MNPDSIVQPKKKKKQTAELGHVFSSRNQSHHSLRPEKMLIHSHWKEERL